MQSTLQTFNNKNFAFVNSNQQEFLAQEKTLHQTVFNCSLKIRQEEIQSRDQQLEFKILKSLTQEMYKSKQLLTDFEFQKQNRYKNILAFKDTAVKLNLSLPLNGENYINANFVQNKYSKRQPLILTQGPKKQTATKFWQMLETYQCQTVVAILSKKEIGSKCFKYWPEKLMDSNLYLIETVANGQTSLFEYKKFKVLNKQTAVNFFVEHFLITAWKDHDTLNQRFFSKFMKFLNFLNDKRKRDNSPLVIHCSAGIGRSGTLAASLFLQESFLKTKNQKTEFYFSVFDIVKTIREQRFKAVQNINQYSFLYELVKNFNQIYQTSFHLKKLFLKQIIQKNKNNNQYIKTQQIQLI